MQKHNWGSGGNPVRSRWTKQRAWVVALLLVTAAILAAQFPRLPKIPSIPKGVPGNVSGNVPGLDKILSGEPPITTGLKDAVTELPFLDGYDPKAPVPMMGQVRSPNGGYLLAPGLYEMLAQSYCLHAGSHAPSKGNGYMYAPLKGPRSEVIGSILRRSVDYPGIGQHQIQSLIWAILARTKVQDLSRDNQRAASQLLTPEQIFEINGGALGLVPDGVRRQAMANLPEPVRRALEAEAQLRATFMRGNASYEELERVAVLFGDVPPGEGSRSAPSGRWSYHVDGYFVRYIPSGYPRTRIEVYVPEHFTIAQDRLGRITRIADQEGNLVEAEYDDSIAPLEIPRETARGYAWKLVRFVRPYPSQPLLVRQVEIRNSGWTLARTAAADRGGAPAQGYQGWQRRYADARQWEEQIQRFNRQPGGRASRDYDLTLNLLHFQKALEAVADRGSRNAEWLPPVLERGYNAAQLAFCRFAGGCRSDVAQLEPPRERLLPAAAGPPSFLLLAGFGQPPGQMPSRPPSAEPLPPLLPFDPSRQVAVPADTNRQRLAQSERPGAISCDQVPGLEQILKDKEKARNTYEKLKDGARTCKELHDHVVDELNRGCPDCKVKVGGTFDPREQAKPKGECADACATLPSPLCQWVNAACQAHEKQHADDWTECKGFPSKCAKDQQKEGQYCAEQENKAYEKEIEALSNYLKNARKACPQPQ